MQASSGAAPAPAADDGGTPSRSGRGGEEHVGARERPQSRGRVLRSRSASRAGPPSASRTEVRSEEVAIVGVQAGQDLVAHVVDDDAVVAQRLEGAGTTPCALQLAQADREPQRRRPAGGQPEQPGGLSAPQAQSPAAQELLPPRRASRPGPRPDLDRARPGPAAGPAAARAPRARPRQRGAQRHLRRQLGDDRRAGGHAGLEVVEHQTTDERAVEVVRDGQPHRPRGASPTAGGSSSGRREIDPRERPRVPRRPLLEQRRLAVARRRDERQRSAFVEQRADESRPRDRVPGRAARRGTRGGASWRARRRRAGARRRRRAAADGRRTGSTLIAPSPSPAAEASAKGAVPASEGRRAPAPAVSCAPPPGVSRSRTCRRALYDGASCVTAAWSCVWASSSDVLRRTSSRSRAAPPQRLVGASDLAAALVAEVAPARRRSSSGRRRSPGRSLADRR